MKRPAPRQPLRFSTQTLLLQLGVVLLVVLLSGAVHAWLTYERLGREAENQALTLARTVASDPAVRREVLAISRGAGTPPASVLLAGPLMAVAEGARTRTGALFVVITDETGLRLAHPDADRLGEKVSTDPSEALSGKEVTTRNTGTLGPSAGAKVPVFAPDSDTVVGEVSVGYSTESIVQSLARDITPIALTAAGSLLAGVLASFLLRRRLQRLTLGLEPEEISTLVHDQVAVLQGVDEGVIGVSADGRISVFNAAAQRLLGQPDLAGTPWEQAPVPEQLQGPDPAGRGRSRRRRNHRRCPRAGGQRPQGAAPAGGPGLGGDAPRPHRTAAPDPPAGCRGHHVHRAARPAPRVRQPAAHHCRFHEHRAAPAGPRLPGAPGRRPAR